MTSMPLTDEEFVALLPQEPHKRAQAMIAWRHLKEMNRINDKSREWVSKIGLIGLENILGEQIEV